MIERVHRYKEKEPLFEASGVEKEIRSTLDRRVDLPSGGYLVFDYAEAFTVVDVNTGRFVGSRSKTSNQRLEDTITKNNLEAVKEVVRQLRLRDIGGIIVIDFIDMANPKNRASVEDALRTELERDRTKTYVVEISPLGLVEMTRQNVTDGPREILTAQVPDLRRRRHRRLRSDGDADRAPPARARTPGNRVQAYKVALHPRVASLLAGPGGSRLAAIEEAAAGASSSSPAGGRPRSIISRCSRRASSSTCSPSRRVAEGATVELKLGEVGHVRRDGGRGKIDGIDVIVADAAKLVGKKANRPHRPRAGGQAFADAARGRATSRGADHVRERGGEADARAEPPQEATDGRQRSRTSSRRRSSRRRGRGRRSPRTGEAGAEDVDAGARRTSEDEPGEALEAEAGETPAKKTHTPRLARRPPARKPAGASGAEADGDEVEAEAARRDGAERATDAGRPRRAAAPRDPRPDDELGDGRCQDIRRRKRAAAKPTTTSTTADDDRTRGARRRGTAGGRHGRRRRPSGCRRRRRRAAARRGGREPQEARGRERGRRREPSSRARRRRARQSTEAVAGACGRGREPAPTPTASRRPTSTSPMSEWLDDFDDWTRIRYTSSARGPCPRFSRYAQERPGYAIISLGGKQYRVREGERLARRPARRRRRARRSSRTCCSSAATARRCSPPRTSPSPRAWSRTSGHEDPHRQVRTNAPATSATPASAPHLTQIEIESIGGKKRCRAGQAEGGGRSPRGKTAAPAEERVEGHAAAATRS